MRLKCQSFFRLRVLQFLTVPFYKNKVHLLSIIFLGDINDF
jgi:hypothetical protein